MRQRRTLKCIRSYWSLLAPDRPCPVHACSNLFGGCTPPNEHYVILPASGWLKSRPYRRSITAAHACMRTYIRKCCARLRSRDSHPHCKHKLLFGPFAAHAGPAHSRTARWLWSGLVFVLCAWLTGEIRQLCSSVRGGALSSPSSAVQIRGGKDPPAHTLRPASAPSVGERKRAYFFASLTFSTVL